MDLFQKPRKHIRGEESDWYENQVIGRDPLNNLMKQISTDAKLSKIYTNHSVRATCLTKLDEAGFEIRHIQAVSGHKSEESIKSYSRRCPEVKKKEMATALNTAFTGNITKPKPSSAMSKNPDDIVDFVPIENNANEFDIGKIINEVSKEEFIKTLEQIEQQQPEENQQNIEPQVPPPPPNNPQPEPVPATAMISNQENTPPVPDMENAITPTQSVVNNFTNQAQPILPRMIFNNSAVTINYNFNIKK